MQILYRDCLMSDKNLQFYIKQRVRCKLSILLDALQVVKYWQLNSNANNRR